MIGHRINSEMVEKCIAYYQRAGRMVWVEAVRLVGQDVVEEGLGFGSASEAADYFKCRIWNAGLVR